MASKLLTPKQAAEFLGVHPVSLEKWRNGRSARKGKVPPSGPRYIRLGERSIRYRQEDLEAWQARHSSDPEAEAEPMG